MPTDNTNGTAPTVQAPRKKAYDETLRAALHAYKLAENLTNGELARELDVGPTRVSKYLNATPDGDVVTLEQNARDVLKTAPTRRKLRVGLFETTASIEVNSVCELIRKTNDIGLIHGPAGSGKTRGIDAYCIANPATIRVTLSKWDGGAAGLEAAIYAQMDTRGRTRSTRRCTWMLDTLRGSNRLLLIDNAHRLTKGARQWLFDFYDETRQPIGLIGNPEVLDAISENDQQFSRIGVLRDVQVEKPADFAKSMLQLHCPEHTTVLLKLATRVVAERGHGRALLKHLLLLPEFITVAQGDVREAFKMAHTQLINSNAYTLEE